MRYDAATHIARAALLMEAAGEAPTTRQRTILVAHASIARSLAQVARLMQPAVCMFADDRMFRDDGLPLRYN